MTEEDLPHFPSFDEPEQSAQQLRGGGVATETIDLTSLLMDDVYASGSFDLSSVGSTAFGKLLDALPMPAILIDQWYSVGFANQSCGKITPDYRKLRGVPFLDLVPRPVDSERAQALADKTELLLERVFSTRKPRVAEAILEIHKNRIWAKLHLRAVRIASDRHVLVLIEDLTHDKKQLELNRRRESESRKVHDDLVKRLQDSNWELTSTAERLRRETADHLKTQRELRTEKKKCTLLLDESSTAAALVAPTGTFQEINRRFTEMFGYDLGDVPNLRQWITEARPESAAESAPGVDWLETLNQSAEKQVALASATVTCKDGTAADVSITGIRLDDGYYFLTCRRTSTS